MAALVTSDIWRDGGSLSATVLDGDGHRSFWLQTNRWNHPRNAGHENLFVSDGDRPESKSVLVAIASTEEARWLAFLEKVDDSVASPDSRKRFRSMVAKLRARHSTAST